MTSVLLDLANTLADSPLRTGVVYLLRNVPGLPPIVQTIHILSVAAIMGSAVIVDLKVLGLALPSQGRSELVRRLMPWTWRALAVLALTGGNFFLARPPSYVVNPVFRLKFTMLVPAVILAAIVHRTMADEEGFWQRTRLRALAAKMVAALSLLLWIGVAMAGRWIAYADYLFPE